MTDRVVLPEGFASILFERAAPEDLARYAPATLAALARNALAHFSGPRQAGHYDIKIHDPEGLGADVEDVTIIEVVNDNMPFLLDSTLAEIGEQGLDLRLVAHPVLAVSRKKDGALDGALRASDPAAGALPRESLIHIHVARLPDPAARDRLIAGLERVYADVRLSVEDWTTMRSRVAAAAEAYKADPPPLPADEITEAVHFLEWLAANNFTFLGLREYRFPEEALGKDRLGDAIGGPGLGILRDPEMKVLRRGAERVNMTPEIMEFLREPQALIIGKANMRSRVHRRTHLDYVGVKLFSKTGALQGELRVVGLFTATAYTSSTRTIPYLRHKVRRVLEAARLDPEGHSGKVLINVLENYPRDELFQMDAGMLAEFAAEIALLYERPRLRVLARADRFDRFVSVLCYIPRDRYDTRVRQGVGNYLAAAFRGRMSAVYPFHPEGPLVRLHYIIGRDQGVTPRVSREQLEQDIGSIILTWDDALKQQLVASAGDAGRTLAARYAGAFSASYAGVYDAQHAMRDIAVIESLADARNRASVMWRSDADAPGQARLKFYSRGRPLPLSGRVPMLEQMGFRVISEDTFEIAPEGGAMTWLHDMVLERAAGGAIDFDAAKPEIEALTDALFRDEVEGDSFNALTLEASIRWREVALLRTLGRYLQQVRIGFSQDYLAATLVRHPKIARKLVDLFYARFDPRLFDDMETRGRTEASIAGEIESLLGAVTSLDEDRILRRFLNLVQSALRTNYFQTGPDGAPRSVIAIKFDSRRVANMPLPRPHYEIYVHAPRVDGVHLRFGKVARGGLRWSDRPQDFRTEVLGLVKAQQVKNAVIVPVGAKGGFVPKRLPPASQRDAWMAEGIAAYRIFVGSLLDITDNISTDGIVPPANTVRHDADDPYLVVAADKGTATFSDIANALSLDHGHWLGDAFASGGSAGYDHKGMGITARGAWEAVKRHFREMDVDIQTTPFTCAGVGDMSGDVFGNGMLLSPQTKLVAAFDHRDIFIDPDPDPATGLAERQRLFALPRSSWQDYDKALISKGGGIWPRSAKSIELSPQAQAAIGLAKPSATPQEVMTAILKAPVDLLWFGGIGTYVRARPESDDQVGDRANDPIRVAGGDLRAKVVGEGANLGMTQLGRIEAAMAGVRLDTDAIDNSAGVNTSDVEVNIKIALAQPMREGRLDLPQRNELLASMTDEVAAIVLRNNYQQSLALSLAERRAAADIGFMRRLMQALEREDRLDRTVEYLPDDLALAEREAEGRGLTRPELAILLAYAKLALHDALLDSAVPDDPWLGRELQAYFPHAVTEQFPDAVAQHRLRREIVATALANSIVNRGGPAIVTRVSDETGADAATIAFAFAAVREVFGLRALNDAIDGLDNRVPGAMQLDLYAQTQNLLLDRMVWFIRNVDFSGGLEGIGARFRPAVEILADSAATLLPLPAAEAIKHRAAALESAGVPQALAQRLAALDAMTAAPDIALVAERAGADVASVAATFFAAESAFGLRRLATEAGSIKIADYYDRLALDRALERLWAARRAITAEIVATAEGATGEARVAEWISRRGPEVERVRRQMSDVAASGLSLSKLTVAAGLLGDLARA